LIVTKKEKMPNKLFEEGIRTERERILKLINERVEELEKFIREDKYREFGRKFIQECQERVWELKKLKQKIKGEGK